MFPSPITNCMDVNNSVFMTKLEIKIPFVTMKGVGFRFIAFNPSASVCECFHCMFVGSEKFVYFLEFSYLN